MSRLNHLYEDLRQSPWLDNLRRGWILDGELARWVERGVRGITSNPTTFQKAIESSSEYDGQFQSLVAGGRSVEDIYWDMVTSDIRSALEILRPVHEASGGVDGYVSLEVAPELAHDEAATVAAARSLHRRIDQPNLFVKVPATAEGVRAIRQLISEGHSINVTLIFGLERYEEVIEAYISGLEAHLEAQGSDADLSGIDSVASFFVSRVDTEVDRRLEGIGSVEALSLRGKSAIAQAQLAYQIFKERFSGPRWQRLVERGAHVQRPLWASTSTKNPAYPDTLYIDALIGPHTVSTMPEATLDAFDDHGELARTVDADPEAARQVLDQVEAAGVDLASVSAVLEDQGVASFAKSFDELLAVLSVKTESMSGNDGGPS